MRDVLRGRVGMAVALAVVAVVASGATAGAARLITGKQIKDGSISAKDLSSALRKQIAAPGPTGAQGPKGDAGAPGATGVPGSQGKSGGFTPANISLVTGPSTTFPDTFLGGAVPQSNAQCPAGAVAIGGYWEMEGPYFSEPNPFITSYRQPSDPRMWSVSLSWPMSYNGDVSYHAVAVCATPS